MFKKVKTTMPNVESHKILYIDTVKFLGYNLDIIFKFITNIIELLNKTLSSDCFSVRTMVKVIDFKITLWCILITL